MSRAQAFRVLCGCLTRELSPARRDEIRQLARSDGFAWEIFVELASRTLVAPALLDAARANGTADIFPAEVADYLDGMATLNRQRNEHIRTECLDLAALLNTRQTVAVTLKGAAHLLSSLHADPSHRIMLDLDLLVPEPRLLDCVALMRAQGYQVISDNGYPDSHHYSPLARPGAHASVELHIRPLDDAWGGLLTADEVFATASEMQFGSTTLALPSAQARIVHAIAHAQLADHAWLNGQFSLRDLLDYARLCDAHAREIDWADIRDRFVASRAATALGYHAIAANALLGVPIADEIPVGTAARLLFRSALWQLNHPRLQDLRIRLLRPVLLFRRAMSSATLRRKLLRDLTSKTWLKRQWQMLRSRAGQAP